MTKHDNTQLNNNCNYRGVVLRDIVSCEYLLCGQEKNHILNGASIDIVKNEILGISGRTRTELLVLIETLASMRAYYKGTAVLSSMGAQRKKRRIVDDTFYIDSPNMLQGSMLVLEQVMYATQFDKSTALDRQKYIMDLLVDIGMKSIMLQKIDTLSYNIRLMVAMVVGLLSNSQMTIVNVVDQQFSYEEIVMLNNVATCAKKLNKGLVIGTMQPNLIGMALDNVAYVIGGKVSCHESVEQLCARLDKVSFVIKGTDYHSMKNTIESNIIGAHCYVSDNVLIVSCADDIKASTLHDLLDNNNVQCDYIKVNRGRVINSFEELVKNHDL